MTSPTSPSDDANAPSPKSSSFERLDERIKKWVWRQEWDGLKEAQELAIPAILAADRNLIIGAPTAAGKTEAAFLPICSELLAESSDGISALYVGPLKALINDQFRRLDEMCQDLGISVNRWHGDVAASRKRKLLKKPSGILLITPESLEALFVLQGHRMGTLFGNLRWIVIDELHAYIGSERGRHLQSLLRRLESATNRKPQRVGLSATLGEMKLASKFLRPHDPDHVEILEIEQAGQSIQLQIRGYLRSGAMGVDKDEEKSSVDSAMHAISRHIYEHLRGNNNLIFANSRNAVETYADQLRRKCETTRVPNEFFPHHGNLSKELRESLEERLKDSTLPTSAVCTSTLEMGVDIGRVKSIAQIGPTFSVASLRQRLGRSGRRDEPAILRFYVPEDDINDKSHLIDCLRLDLVQSIAMTELLIEGWCEPPDINGLHLSTLIHQIMALIAERGGVKAAPTWQLLCGTGPFSTVDKQAFANVLRKMAESKLVEQDASGEIFLGEKGERIVNHYTFFAVFSTPEEYRLICDGKELGTMEFGQTLMTDISIIFAGRRWKVVKIDEEQKLILVKPTSGGRPPNWEGSGGEIADEIRQRMEVVYESGHVPNYLNKSASQLLQEGRSNYMRLGFDESHLLAHGSGSILLTLRGDRIVGSLVALFAVLGAEATLCGSCLEFSDHTTDEVKTLLKTIAESDESLHREAEHRIAVGSSEKFTWALSKELRRQDYLSHAVDLQGAKQAASRFHI